MTADAVGGVWTYAVELARGLAENGVQITLAVLGPAASRRRLEEASSIAGLDLIETGLPLDWMANEPSEIEESAAVIRGLARRAGADLIHVNSPALAAGGAHAIPVIGICHSCLATWWGELKTGPMPESFRWRTRSLWRGMLACDALAAPSHAFAVATSAAHETSRPVVIHNGRDPVARPARDRETIAFTAGRLWDEGKNVAVVDAASALTAVPVYAAGPTLDPSTLNGITLEHATALGELSADDVGEWLQRASIYVTSARYEPFGLSVLEAAQAGCALILSDIPTFRELWNGAAVFLQPDDAAGFAAAMTALAGDESRARRLGERARIHAQRYSRAAMTAGVLDLYRTVQVRAGHAEGAAA
jgi:glycosyltransferase involved in cell wall biosynthesis